IIASYLVNIGYYQNSQKLLFNKTLPFSTSIKKSSKFYWRFLFLRFLFLLAIFLPIIIIYAFSFFLLAKNNLVAGLILLLFSLLFIVVWITYISIRLFFIEAILYIDDANLSGVLKKSSSKNIIKKSLKVSKGKMRKIFIIAILIYGLSALINSFSGEPILDSFLEMIFNTNLATLPIFLSLFLLFIAINASLNCLMNIFLLKSYIEFKNGQNTSSVSNN
ncbi:MAG: hypothetical protein KC550_07765, partial [Nanoarchaeota archaeon]|nr:hypothetical protein [Nanoarchaeota archaeon]